MLRSQLTRPPSFRGSLKGLEADVNHANTLADAIRRTYGGACLQMRVSCSPLASVFLFLMQWLDCTCSCSLPSYLGLFQILVHKVYVDGMRTISTFERRASIREFYAIIYPSLQQLESNLVEREQSNEKGRAKEMVGGKRMEEWKKLADRDLDRDDENVRSQSCPFCRGSLKRVQSRDLWVLTNRDDVIDTVALEMDNVRRFYRYIDSLPLIIPDTLFLVYYDYIA
ncbi:zinc finger, RING-type [Musa troglodytarum]|uniref:Zinc finger, RING-type n=1 Tax=Musa troglodytarum TaxID=320322 RepID=A0A9E7GKI7_9LILI|nr:zinc finger, RING-type [Musa troglodytarum]